MMVEDSSTIFRNISYHYPDLAERCAMLDDVVFSISQEGDTVKVYFKPLDALRLSIDAGRTVVGVVVQHLELIENQAEKYSVEYALWRRSSHV